MADDFDLMGGDDFFNSDNEDDFFGGGDNSGGGSGGSDADFFGSSNSDESSDSDDDDFFGESSGRRETSDNQEEDLQSDEEKNRALRRIALISLGVAAGIIIIICIIGRVVAVGRRGSVSKPKNEQRIEQTVQSNPVVNNNVTGNSNSGGNSEAGKSKSDWQEVKYNTVGNLDATVDDAIFTVTKIESFAKVMADGEVQVRTEATGSISGLSGVYIVDIPFNLTGVVSVGKKLSVSYDIGSKNNMRVVGNIRIVQ